MPNDLVEQNHPGGAGHKTTIYTNKKRDRNLAVPLIEALVLPFVPNNNTEAHAEYVHARTHIYT